MTMQQSLRAERTARLMGAVALALVLGALGFQVIRHLAPCEMCHWQRWPHIAAAAIGIVGVTVYRKQPGLGAALTIVIVAGLGLAVTHQWQNWPVAVAAAVLAVAALAIKDARGLALMVIALVAVSGLIGLYQTGMQLGILPGPQACTVSHPYMLGSNAPPPEVSCNVVTWSLFGLSLAAYNAIFSLGAAALALLLLKKK
jgi:disulfide bond formation protein DsbB